MATLDELGSLPPVTVEFELFDYAPLDSPLEPPPLELRARLAREYEASDDDEADDDGLRLAFVAGRPIDSHDVLVLSYIWRARTEDVRWGMERWPSPERTLRPYHHDSTFEGRDATDVHTELRDGGAASVAEMARRLLER